MNELKQYNILEVGQLKYNRIKSISLFKKILNTCDFNYSINETKIILDLILENNYNELFCGKMKHCIDIIFHNMKYIKNNTNNECEEKNFPDN